MRATLLGFKEQRVQYVEMLMRCGCSEVDIDHVSNATDLVLFADVQNCDEIIAQVQALRHVFVFKHQLSLDELRFLHKLTQEAAVVMQFSAPTLYEWNIPNLGALLCDIRLVQVHKDVEQSKPVSYTDLQHELLAAVCLIDERVNKVAKSRSIVPCDFEVMGFQVDFINAAGAHFWVGSGAFVERHELRFFASNGTALIDVLKGSMILKTADGTAFTSVLTPQKEAQEKEITDFIQAILQKKMSWVNETKMIELREVQKKLFPPQRIENLRAAAYGNARTNI